ncbi:MAG TPA: hypothetical protein VGP35_09480, partial [Terriglobales bacterium]|nr:hypothetical protein [Terriglobales bacterium]
MSTEVKPIAPATGEVAGNLIPTQQVHKSVLRFIDWLQNYGEVSYDFQSYFSSDLTRAAKALYYKNPILGTIAVSPMVFSEAFVPSARRLFWKPQRFPIADAHYAMGFGLLAKFSQPEKYH